MAQVTELDSPEAILFAGAYTLRDTASAPARNDSAYR